MKLAASNIAWATVDDEIAATLLRRYGFTGVEIAPTKYWADLTRVRDVDLHTCRQHWANRGLTISSLQALLFGQPDLQVFASPAVQARTLDYLRQVCHIGAVLGAESLVFGAPTNRQRGSLSNSESQAQALDFFAQVGEIAQAAGVSVCIEPNPPAYACDFITTAAEGAHFVATLNHSNIGLHLDSAAMHLVGDAINFTHLPLQHFHASEPQLAPLGSTSLAHHDYAMALQLANYNGWVAVEMRTPEESPLTLLEQALRYAQVHYGNIP